MDITQKPNLKPLRQYAETDVINGFFSHADASANKGSFVSIVAAKGNTNVWQNASSPATPHLDVAGAISNVPSYTYAVRHEVTWKVKNAYSGENALGILLYDVRETNAYGEKYLFRPRYERAEQDIVISGEAVPIVTRGLFKINGFVGTPGPGSGAVLSTTSGQVLVTNNVTGATNVGKFLTTADADGYALFKLEL